MIDDLLPFLTVPCKASIRKACLPILHRSGSLCKGDGLNPDDPSNYRHKLLLSRLRSCIRSSCQSDDCLFGCQQSEISTVTRQFGGENGLGQFCAIKTFLK